MFDKWISIAGHLLSLMSN